MLLPFGTRLARLIFLWQQDSSPGAIFVRRATLRRVHSGGQVVRSPRDQLPRSPIRPAPGGDERLQISPDSVLRLDECRSFVPSSSFGLLVTKTARRAGVEPRALAVRALLHLPRVASYKGSIKRREVRRELKIIAGGLRRDVRAARRYVPHNEFTLSDLTFEEIDSSRAFPILMLLHYLRSARRNSLYFGLVDPVQRLPVTLCSLSPLQWARVSSHISSRFAIPPQKVWDVSRVYSLDNAPNNAISMLLSKVRNFVRNRLSSVDLLLTVVDPNLGFTGSSYRAANWQQWMTIKARPYFYERGWHVTPRQLRERFGSSNLVQLQATHPGRFEQSRARLLDSMIFCSSVNEKTKVVLAQEMHHLRR